MKIQSIKNFSTTPFNQNKNLKYNNQSLAYQSKNDSFCKQQVNFTGYHYPVNFNDAKSLKDIAEYFWNEDKDSIKSKVCKKHRSETKNQRDFETLMPFIEDVRTKMDYLGQEINELGPVIAGESYDIVQQKRRVKRGFFDMVKAEKDGFASNIPNGILVYGNSQKGVDELTDWIKTTGKIYSKEIDFNPQDPLQSISDMVEVAKFGEQYYQTSGIRTLLTVNHLDELLTNDDTQEGRANIGRFKNFVENVSENYHTTILMKTDKNLSDFEEASIGDQRFNLKVKINNREATPEEVERYAKAKEEFDRIYSKTPEDPKFYDDGDSDDSLTDHWVILDL